MSTLLMQRESTNSCSVAQKQEFGEAVFMFPTTFKPNGSDDHPPSGLFHNLIIIARQAR
jgi:hypothetical protein